MKSKPLNTIESFTKGFRIKRNGKIITLTAQEMAQFRNLDTALIGRECLEIYKNNVAEDQRSILEEMISNENICYDLENEILDDLFEEASETEACVIENAIEKYKIEKSKKENL